MATITNSISTNNVTAVVQSNGGALNIGTLATATAITIGNVTGATALVLNAGTGGIALTSTSTGDITANSSDMLLLDSVGVLELNSSGASISIGNDAVAQNINIGTGAASRVITVGNGTSTTTLAFNAGTGGINVGTNAIAHPISIGNTTGATSVTFNTGSGGINIPSFTTTGALVSNALGVITDADAATSGWVLTSNGAGSPPSFQAAGASGITTLDADSGSATGSTVGVKGGSSGGTINLNTFASGSDLEVRLNTHLYIDAIDADGLGSGELRLGSDVETTSIFIGDTTNTTGLVNLLSGSNLYITGVKNPAADSTILITAYNSAMTESSSILLGITTGRYTVKVGRSGDDAGTNPVDTYIGNNLADDSVTTIDWGDSGGSLQMPALTLEGALVNDDTGLVTSADASTAGWVLTANGSGAAPTFQAAAAGGIVTLDGDTGSATGSTVTIAGGSNITTSAASATVTVNLDDAIAITTVTASALNLNFGANASDTTIVIGNSTGATPVSVNAGTGGLNLGTNAIAHTVTIGNVTGATAVAVNSGTGGIALVSTGSGDITANSSDTLLLDSAGVLELNSSGGAINIGNDAVAQAINVGTGAAARTVTLGNITGATAVNINTGTGGNVITTTNGVHTVITGSGVISIGASATTGAISIGNSSAAALSLASGAASTLAITNQTLGITTGTGTLSISADAAATTVNIATGAAAKALVLGSTNTTSGVTINAGSAGITVPTFNAFGVVVNNSSGLLSSLANGTSGYILKSNGTGSNPSWVASTAFSIVNQNSSSVTMSPFTKYMINNGASLVTLTLPAAAAQGDSFIISGGSAGGWAVAQGSGQTIHFGNVDTTTGAGGSLASTVRYDCITITCNIANTDFVVEQSMGNITYV